MKYKLKEGKQLTMYDLVNTKWHTTVENRDFLLFYFTGQGFANSHYNGDKRCEPYLFVHATNVEIQWGIGGRGTYDDSNHRAMKFDDWFEEAVNVLKDLELVSVQLTKDPMPGCEFKKDPSDNVTCIKNNPEEGSFEWTTTQKKFRHQGMAEGYYLQWSNDGYLLEMTGNNAWISKEMLSRTDWEIFEEKTPFEKQLDDFVSDVLAATEIKTNSEPSKEFMIKMRRLCDAHTKEFDKIKRTGESKC